MEAKLTGIDRNETLQYLGWLGSRIPDDLNNDIARCENLILDTARPRAVWRLFDLLPDGQLAGTGFRPEGRDVPELLKDCSQVILRAATLGSEIERLLRQSQARSMGAAPACFFRSAGYLTSDRGQPHRQRTHASAEIGHRAAGRFRYAAGTSSSRMRILQIV